MRTTLHNKRVSLFIAYINSHMPELIRAALFLKANGYEPTFLYVNVDEPIRQDYLLLCKKNNITVINEFNRIIKPIEKPLNRTHLDKIHENFYQKVRSSLIRKIKKSHFIYALSLALYKKCIPFMRIRNIIHRIEYAKYILAGIKPDILIFAEENAFYQTSIYVHAAKKLKIPSIIFPYTIANAVENAEHVYTNPSHQVKGVINIILSLLYPHWVYTFHQKKLFAQPPLFIILSELFHLSPPDPWMINSGFSDAIAVESKFMMKYYLKNGLPKDRMHVTGSLSDDVLYKNYSNKISKRNILYKELKIANYKPMLLCAISPPFFPRYECEFHNFEQLNKFWMETLTKYTKYNILLTLHPRLDRKKMSHLEKFGVKIANWTTAELIPLCDIYIANVSATIRWAIACGIPVLNYDVYKYRFHDYDSAKGVITIENKKDFQKYVDRILTDGSYLEMLRKEQKVSMNEWGMVDGKSGGRILKLVKTLTPN